MSAVLLAILQIASILLIARALLSWLPASPDSFFYRVARVVDQLTEPIVGPVRRLMPRTGGFDFSVLVVLLGINLILVPIAASL